MEVTARGGFNEDTLRDSLVHLAYLQYILDTNGNRKRCSSTSLPTVVYSTSAIPAEVRPLRVPNDVEQHLLTCFYNQRRADVGKGEAECHIPIVVNLEEHCIVNCGSIKNREVTEKMLERPENYVCVVTVVDVCPSSQLLSAFTETRKVLDACFKEAGLVSPQETRFTGQVLRTPASATPMDLEDLRLVAGCCEDIGKKRTMEDRVVVEMDLNGSVDTPDEAVRRSSWPRRSFFGIYDGHRGMDCVNIVDNSLVAEVARLCTDRTGDIPNCFVAALETCEEKTRQWLVDKKEIPQDGTGISSGSAICATVIEEGKIVVANLGDSRAILSRAGTDIALTCDHRVTDNPREKERIAQLGIPIDSDGYLKGEMILTRAIGDIYFDNMEKFEGVLVVPEVTVMQMKELDEFLIVACDGIFDVMRSSMAVKTVRQSLARNPCPTAAAKELMKRAQMMDSSDNLSVVVVAFHSSRVNLPCVENKACGCYVRDFNSNMKN